MRFFGKKQISFVSFVALLISSVASFTYLLFLFNSEAFAATYLKNIKLENSSSSTQYHLESTSPPCSTGGITERVIDEFSNRTITRYGSQYLSRNCQRKTESYIFTTVKYNCELSPPYATSRDTGENCNEIPITALNTLSLNAGSVRETWSMAGCALLCSFPFEWSGFDITTGESSLTLTIDCQGEEKARLLEIKAKGFIISEAQPTGMEFLINGFSPSSVYPEDSDYSDLYKVYVWSGILKWKIPIDKKCGENITITPSVAGGYGQVAIDSISAIDCEVNVDVFPSDVMPEKTGNNVAEVMIALAVAAPQGGQVVDLTVEPIEGSGGHNHDGSRLKGEITDNDGNKIDTIFFAEGKTQKQVKYKATEIAGEEKIIAEIRGGLTKCEETVNVKVPELSPLVSKPNLLPWGGTAKHKLGDNNYGTGYTLSAVYYAVGKYAKYYALNTAPDVYLAIIDMSLPYGGLFDINGDWSTPHDWHRVGRSVDFSKYYKDSGGNNIQVVFYDEDGNVIETTDLINDDKLDKYFEVKHCSRQEKRIGKIHYQCPN